ncbi:MAG: DNA-binding protein [Halomonas sp.]|uniref:DNA-binding protein n=1 Tax=Halomonas sp. TaxID=1486246 RepID=UPI0017ACA567|nr:DNA-binding protein [Halomonas sp.]NWN83580.1 DNA-binding protein [Halomonas sp.]
MARTGVTYEDVQRAIDELLTGGDAPSVQRIREVLGTGSFTTISDHLRTWRQQREENRDVPPPRGMPAALQELAEGLWRQAQESANETLRHYREEADRRVDEAQESVAEARRQAEDARQREAALAEHLAGTEQRLEALSAQLATSQAQVEALQATENRLATRLAEAESLAQRYRDEAGRVAEEHRQALQALDEEHHAKLTREEQRHESAETRLMTLLDQTRQERLVQEKAAAGREEQLEKRLARRESEWQEACGRLAEEEKRHRESEGARREAEVLAETRQHEQALLQARIDEQKRHLEEQSQRVKGLEEQLYRCLWEGPAAAENTENTEEEKEEPEA